MSDGTLTFFITQVQEIVQVLLPATAHAQKRSCGGQLCGGQDPICSGNGVRKVITLLHCPPSPRRRRPEADGGRSARRQHEFIGSRGGDSQVGRMIHAAQTRYCIARRKIDTNGGH